MGLTDEMRERLLRQSHDRLADMMSEMLWTAVVGSPDFRTPPPWVARAIEKFAGPSVAQLRSIPKLIRGQLPLEEVGEMAGAQKAASAFLANPGEQVEAAEKSMPGLTEQRKAILKIAAQTSAKVSQVFEPDPSKLTAEGAGSFLAGQSHGARAVVEGINEEETLTQQICIMMWLFWPTIQSMANRGVLRRWLDESCGMKCTPELVEKTCNEIGFSPAKRGRPKNTTGGKKIISIKKSVTGVKSGHDKARRHREPTA